MEKQRKLTKALAALLCLCMVASLLPVRAALAAGTDDKPERTSPLAPGTRTADPDTTDGYIAALLDGSNGTRYAGRVWADKSVFGAGGDVAAVELDYDTDGWDGTVMGESDFLHVFSALGSDEVVNKYPADPVDMVLVLDVSESMGQGDLFLNGAGSDITASVEEAKTAEGMYMVSRMERLADAANDVIGQIMARNEANRVSVVVYDRTATVVMPLAHYTPNTAGAAVINAAERVQDESAAALEEDAGAQLSTEPIFLPDTGTTIPRIVQREDNGLGAARTETEHVFAGSHASVAQMVRGTAVYPYLQPNWDTYIDSTGTDSWKNGAESAVGLRPVATPDDPSVITCCYARRAGTNLQAGLAAGLEILAEEPRTQDTIDLADGTTAQAARIPAVLVLSDGASETVSPGSWYAPQYTEPAALARSVGGWSSLVDLETLLTASYYKSAAAKNYAAYTGGDGAALPLYTVGVDLRAEDWSVGRLGVLLDPADYFRPDVTDGGDEALPLLPEMIDIPYPRPADGASWIREAYTAWEQWRDGEEPALIQGTAAFDDLEGASGALLYPDTPWVDPAADAGDRADLSAFTAQLDQLPAGADTIGNNAAAAADMPAEAEEAADADAEAADETETEAAAETPAGAAYAAARQVPAADGAGEPRQVEAVTKEDIVANIAYPTGFYATDSQGLGQVCGEILRLIVGQESPVVAGLNEAGATDSVTYSDPLGSYMEVKNGGVSVSGVVTTTGADGGTDTVTETQGVYDMALLLFGEMHGLERWAVYDWQFNDRYMEAHSLGHGVNPMTSGWYRGDDPEGQVDLYRGEGLPPGCDTQQDAWKAGWVYRVGYEEAQAFVPTLEKTEDPASVSEKQRNTVYTFYRLCDGEATREALRDNPSYGDRGSAAYRLSDVHVWVEQTGDWEDDQAGVLDPGYAVSVNADIPAQVLPMQVAEITMGRYGVEAYDDNLEDKLQSTPVRLFYTVGVRDDLFTGEGDDRALDVTKLADGYADANRTDDGLNIYLRSSYYSQVVYSGYAANGNVDVERGDARVTFSPADDSAYYIAGGAMPLYGAAYQYTGGVWLAVTDPASAGATLGEYRGTFASIGEAGDPDAGVANPREGDVIFLETDAITDPDGTADGQAPFSGDNWYYLAIPAYVRNGTRRTTGAQETLGTYPGRDVELAVVRRGAELGAGVGYSGAEIWTGDMLCWYDVSGACDTVYPYLPGDTGYGGGSMGRDYIGAPLNADGTYADADLTGLPQVMPDQSAGSVYASGRWVLAMRPGALRAGGLWQEMERKSANNTSTAATVTVPVISDSSVAKTETGENGYIITAYLGNNGILAVPDPSAQPSPTPRPSGGTTPFVPAVVLHDSLLFTKQVRPAGVELTEEEREEEFDYQLYIEDLTSQTTPVVLYHNETAKDDNIWMQKITSATAIAKSGAGGDEDHYYLMRPDGQSPALVESLGVYYYLRVDDARPSATRIEYMDPPEMPEGQPLPPAPSGYAYATESYPAGTVLWCVSATLVDADTGKVPENPYVFMPVVKQDPNPDLELSHVTTERCDVSIQFATKRLRPGEPEELFDPDSFTVDGKTYTPDLEHTAQFTLQHGEGIMLTNRVQGKAYKITEKIRDDQAYTIVGVTHKVDGDIVDYDGEGNIIEKDSGSVDFDPKRSTYSVFGVVSGDKDQVDYVNAPESGLLSISKTLQAAEGAQLNDLDRMQPFIFTVSLALDGEPVEGEFYYRIYDAGFQEGDEEPEPQILLLDADGEAALILTPGQIATIAGLPLGAAYTVTELPRVGYPAQDEVYTLEGEILPEPSDDPADDPAQDPADPGQTGTVGDTAETGTLTWVRVPGAGAPADASGLLEQAPGEAALDRVSASNLAAFVNVKSPAAAGRVSLTGQATTAGGTFVIVPDSGNPADDPLGTEPRTVTGSQEGAIVFFSDLEYAAPGDYRYFVRQDIPASAAPGRSYDGTVYTVTVHVEEDYGEEGYTGALRGTIETSPDRGGLIFSNTYDPDRVTVTLEAQTTLRGKDMTPGEFTFYLTGTQSNIIQVPADVPADGDETPGDDGNTPADDTETPGDDTDTPGDDTDTPAGDDTPTPAGDTQTPTGDTASQEAGAESALSPVRYSAPDLAALRRVVPLRTEEITEPGSDVTPEPGPEPAPSQEPDPEPSAAPDPEPSAEPGPAESPEPSAEPDPDASPEPSAEPGPEESPEPSSEPDPDASPEPSAEPDPDASPEPSPEASPVPGSDLPWLDDLDGQPFDIMALPPMPDGVHAGGLENVVCGANDATGLVRFNPITFTQPGVYEYGLVESKAGAEGYTYDTSYYHIVVTVTRDESSGALQAAVEYQRQVRGASLETVAKDDVVFANRYRSGALAVTAVTVGGDPDRLYHFTVELLDRPEEPDDPQGEPAVRTDISGRFGDLLFTEGTARFTLTDGQIVTAPGLLAGTAYRVREEEADREGYVTTTANAGGRISARGTAAVFVNTFTPGGTAAPETAAPAEEAPEA